MIKLNIMKKILLIISALVLTMSLGAQTKEAVLKSIDKAQATVENPKKATNPSSWMKLGESYINAYTFTNKKFIIRFWKIFC